MNLKRMLPPLCLGSLLSVAFLATVATPAAKAAGDAKTVAGEIILYMQPGTPLKDAQALANTVKPVSFTPLLLQDCYVLELPAIQRNDGDTAAAVASLKADPRVRSVRASWVFKADTAPPAGAGKVEPNDPFYTGKNQPTLGLVNMPQAWALQKGVSGVRLAWIDTGFNPAHEDLIGQYDPASFDYADNDSDVTADGTGGAFDHGTGTSSVGFAKTNNSIGMAGICWEGIKCVAFKIQAKGTGTLSEPAILSSYGFILNNYAKLNIHAVNMSYGRAGGDPNDTTDPEYVATKKMADAGVIPVVSAGNSGGDGNPTVIPSGYAHCLSVSAINNAGKLTYYSSFGKVEIAAPGGEQRVLNDPGGILVLTNDPAQKYRYEQGTSFAAPYVASVLGLILSVPGVTPAIAKDALLKNADRTGLGTLPDAKYGFGILDAYAALSQVSVQAIITSPQGLNANGNSSDPANQQPPPVETFKPTISMHFTNVTPDKITITIDSSAPSVSKSFTLTQLLAGSVPGVSSVVLTGSTSGTNPIYDVSFRVAFLVSGNVQHTISLSAADPVSGITRNDTRLFTITPHTIPVGLSMISIPYFESADDSPSGQFRDVTQLLGTNATLYRYLLPSELGSQPLKSTLGQYAAIGKDVVTPNVNASFRPSNNNPVLTPPIINSGTVLDTRPIGVGYFINTSGSIPVNTLGSAFVDRPVKLPLHEGWNIIGNPFPFANAFNTAQIERLDGTRVQVSEAVDKKLIIPFLYRLVNGDYEFKALPDGTMEAWEGQWIFVTPKSSSSLNAATVLSLVLSPTPAPTSRATTSFASKSKGAGDWTVQLQAFSGEQSDKNNFIGMSSKATDGDDNTKAPKPPRAISGVSLGIVRSTSPATYFAQDLRAIGGAKEWRLEVSNDKPGSDVTLKWSDSRSLPRNYRLVLTDATSGQSVDLRNASSYRFTSGATETTRSFTLTARPTSSNSGKPVISNVVVNQSNAGGGRSASLFDIGYNVSSDVRVSASILGFGGRQVAQIGSSRAVNSGDNKITWNGRDGRGNAVPAGTYVLQLLATGTDGSVSRVVQSLILTGR